MNDALVVVSPADIVVLDEFRCIIGVPSCAGEMGTASSRVNDAALISDGAAARTRRGGSDGEAGISRKIAPAMR